MSSMVYTCRDLFMDPSLFCLYVHVYVSMYKYIYVCTLLCLYIFLCTPTCMNILICAHVHFIHTHMHIYMCSLWAWIQVSYTGMSKLMHVCFSNNYASVCIWMWLREHENATKHMFKTHVSTYEWICFSVCVSVSAN